MNEDEHRDIEEETREVEEETREVEEETREVEEETREMENLEESDGQMKRIESDDVFLKSVTIRGIDKDVYGEFAKSMKILGMNIGEAITKMMKGVLSDFDETFPEVSSKSFRNVIRLPKARIEHHGELSIHASDLVEANSRFSFNHIEYLKLEPDITAEILNRNIRSINHCSRVRYPSTLPKLLLYSKVRHCDTLEMYSVEEEVEKKAEQE